MGNKLIIIFVIIGIIWAGFWLDTRFRLEYRDPFRVAKCFTYSLMVQDKDAMKSWAGEHALNKPLRKKIDKLKFKRDFGKIQVPFSPQERLPREFISERVWDKFHLVAFERLYNEIVCTYMLEMEPFPLPTGTPKWYKEGDRWLTYTVALSKVSYPTLWEKFRNLLYEIPFVGKWVGSLEKSDRWIVIDFYSEDINKFVTRRVKEFERWVKFKKGDLSLDKDSENQWQKLKSFPFERVIREQSKWEGAWLNFVLRRQGEWVKSIRKKIRKETDKIIEREK